MSERPYILAIGQFPPPVNGFTYITEQLFLLTKRYNTARRVDISSAPYKHGPLKHLRRVSRTALAAAHLLASCTNRNRICYLACEGGLGLIYTALLCAVARSLKYRIYLHHHSFSYINKDDRLMRLVLAFGGNHMVHLFLCNTMRDKFFVTYGQTARSLVLSNAAFVTGTDTACSPKRIETQNLRIGLLGNLNKEKGLYTFLELLRESVKHQLNVAGILAGPIADPIDMAAVDTCKSELGELLEYRGALYGQEKLKFYRDIDVFVFPTNYANEAQPTVIFEALAQGVQIISTDRGCIAAQVSEPGLVCKDSDEFVSKSLIHLREIQERITEIAQTRKTIANQYTELHERARIVADNLFLIPPISK